MKWKNVKLIFWRELSDQLRDRRTLFMLLVLPVLLYPTIGFVMLNMTLLFQDQTRTVVLLGAEEMPELSLLEGSQFNPRWFDNEDDASKLNVITDLDLSQLDTQAAKKNASTKTTEKETLSRNALLKDAYDLKAIMDEIDELRKKLPSDVELEGKKPEDLSPEHQQILKSFSQKNAELTAIFVESDIQVLIIIPKGFKEGIREENERLKLRVPGEINPVDYPRPFIIHNKVDDKSLIAYSRAKEAIRAWEQALLEERLSSAFLPTNLPKPVNAKNINVAESGKIPSNIWGKIFPMLLIMMSVTGAFYPAVDLGAGEKERGTMETLLISPASRSEIVLGKFFTVLIFSLTTAMLNLLTMGITGLQILKTAGGGQLQKFGDITMPGIPEMIWIVLLAIPLASLFSSLSLAFAIFARSTKEGQHYLTPLLIVALGITMFCISPWAEINILFSMLPIIGPALLLKSLLSASAAKTGFYIYVVPVFVMSMFYSYASLQWAIDQFKREDVLFREAERFEFKAWLQELMRDKGIYPSFGESVFCFVLMLLLQFMMLSTFSSQMSQLENATDSVRAMAMLQLLIVQQLAIIGTPCVIMALFLTTNVRETLRLNFPHVKYLALGFILPVAVHPLSLELITYLQSNGFFPPIPQKMIEQMEMLKNSNVPFWLVVLSFSIAPAICEELAFRGFILSGFLTTKRVGLAIFLSSLTFGIIHMVPAQVFNATLLGLILGLLAVKSKSLLPGILYHFMNNFMYTMEQRYPLGEKQNVIVSLFVYPDIDNGTIRFSAWTLLISGVITGYIVLYLIRQKTQFVFDKESVQTQEDDSSIQIPDADAKDDNPRAG